MKGFKEPSFQDRAAASARAKTSALGKLAAVPKRDDAEQAARAARQQERKLRLEAKRAVAREAKEDAERLEQERRNQAVQESVRVVIAAPTEAERKAARDERYAARKRRQLEP